jgi:hypothetical protein
VISLKKWYKVARVSRQAYLASYYSSSSIPLKSFDDYFPRLSEEFVPEPEPAGEGDSSIPPEPTSPPESTMSPPLPVLTSNPDPGLDFGLVREGAYAYIPGRGFVRGETDASGGSFHDRYGYYDASGRRYNGYYLLTSEAGAPNDRYQYFRLSDPSSDAMPPDVIIPADGLSKDNTDGRHSLDGEYTGWLRTVWDGVQPYEDMRILGGYDIGLSENAYACDFQILLCSEAGVTRKPLYGGYTVEQQGRVFAVRDLASAALVAETNIGAASAYDFGNVTFAGTSKQIGYLAVVKADSGSNSLIIRILGSNGLLPELSVPFKDIHFLSSEEQAKQDDQREQDAKSAEYMDEYDTPDIPSPDPDFSPSPSSSAIPDATIPSSDLAEQPDDNAADSDKYTPESVLALSGSDFVITSLSNGAVRYYLNGAGTYQAERILEAPIFRSWRLEDGSFLAIGFELQDPAKWYDATDLPMSKVLRYTLN